MRGVYAEGVLAVLQLRSHPLFCHPEARDFFLLLFDTDGDPLDKLCLPRAASTDPTWASKSISNGLP